MTAIVADIAGECRAAVFCVGGAGANIASVLMDRLVNADVIAINTEAGAVSGVTADRSINFHGDVPVGDSKAAKEIALGNEVAMRSLIRNYQYVQIVAAMGGAAGTGIAPVLAQYCALEKVRFSAVAVMPFSFEDRFSAAEGYRDLHSVCKEAVEQFTNDTVLDQAVTLSDAMDKANAMVSDIVQEALSDIPGLVLRKTPPSGESPLLSVGHRVATS